MFHKKLQELGIVVSATPGHYRLHCPQCSSTRKKRFIKELSVTVSDTGGALWDCHHCGWVGGVGKNGVSEKHSRVYHKPQYEDGEIDEKFIAYASATRGITQEALERNRVSRKLVWMHGEDKETPVIAFPYLRGGEVVNVKYRSENKSFRLEKGAELCLYKLDDILGANQVIICEGEWDALSFEVAGFPNCVSVPNGAPPPNAKSFDRHFDYLNSVDFSKVRQFIIAVDSDEPGRILKSELVRRLGPELCFFVEYPAGCKDANDVLVKHGKDALAKLVTEARPIPLAGLIDAASVQDEVLSIYDNGHEAGINPGSPELGYFYTVKPGQLTIVTGVPGSGKSAWVDWVCYSLAESNGWTFGVCSPENHPVSEHVIKFIELKSGRPFAGRDKLSREEAEKCTQWVDKYFTFISLEEDVEDWSVRGILDMARLLVKRKGIRGLVIDPWNQLDHTRKEGLSETEHISRCLSEIRQFARNYGVHVWVVAHPTKLPKEAEGTFPVPNMYSISGSAAWFNTADFGVAIWRDVKERGSPVKVDIQKVRFKHCGNVGTHYMEYDYFTNRYRDLTANF